MEPNHDFENIVERYLLGELSEQEQQQFEESYFADDTLFERFLAVKHDLVDAYARGDLAANKRERFEQHFLASQPRRQRVDEAKQFIRAVSLASTTAAQVSADSVAQSSEAWWRKPISKTFARPLVWQAALVVLLLAALAGSWAVMRHFQNQRAEDERLQSEEAARKKQDEERAREKNAKIINPNGPPTVPSPELPPTPNKQSPEIVPAQVASILLLPFGPRDATGSNSLVLHKETRSVVLRLAFKSDDYRRYDAVLRTVASEQVLSRKGLKATTTRQGQRVAIVLDPSIFNHQDYIVTLSGLTAGGQLETIGDYYFNVKRSTTTSSTPQ